MLDMAAQKQQHPLCIITMRVRYLKLNSFCATFMLDKGCVNDLRIFKLYDECESYNIKDNKLIALIISNSILNVNTNKTIVKYTS